MLGLELPRFRGHDVSSCCVLFVVGGALVCQPALDASGVVEAFDVVEERGPRLVAMSPAGCAVDPGELAFEGGPERLDRGVVEAVARGSEGLIQFEFSDALRKGE